MQLKVILSLLLTAIPALAVDPRIASLVRVADVSMQTVNLPLGALETTTRVLVTLQNISTRTIVSYAYSMKSTYADGNERTMQGSVDALLAMALSEAYSSLGDGSPPPAPRLQAPIDAWRVIGPVLAGESRPYRISVLNAGAGANRSTTRPVKVDLEITALEFDDNTIVGDEPAIATIRDGRRRTLEQESKILGYLNEIKFSDVPRERANQLVETTSKVSPPEGRVWATLKDLSLELEQDSGLVDKFFMLSQRRLAVFQAHANPIEVK
jgi:hypothetical protein